MPNDLRLETTVHGLVQGVFFRHDSRVQALRLGLTGTVRNLPDGTVRVVAEGPREQLEAMLEWLQRGPELADVEWVDAKWSEATEAYSEFLIVR
jgi:acylphosphatase